LASAPDRPGPFYSCAIFSHEGFGIIFRRFHLWIAIPLPVAGLFVAAKDSGKGDQMRVFEAVPRRRTDSAR
jgi:hypothetical protein